MLDTLFLLVFSSVAFDIMLATAPVMLKKAL